MAEFLTSVRVLDLVLACIGAEVAALVCYRLATGENFLPADVLANLFAAAGLVIAARLMIGHGWWGFVGLTLVVALCSHIMAVRLRWRRAASP